MNPRELFITVADGGMRILRLEDKQIILGRGATCELPFPEDAGLSRQHLVIEPDGGDWIVRDMGSKNGTLVNGDRILGRHVLKIGDRIIASRVTLVFGQQEAMAQTVVFDAESIDESSHQTVSTTLDEVLAAGDVVTETGLSTPGKQWATPLQALIRAGRELVMRRPLAELFDVILDLAMEAVSAERGLLMVQEGDDLVPKALHGGDFRISTAVRDRVIKERTSVLIQNVTQDELLQQRQSIVLSGVQSLMAVPLQTDDRVIGLIYLDSHHFFRKFTGEDLNLLTVMANVAAMRIERERLAAIEEAERRHAIELRQAAEIQQRHLPTAPPEWAGLEAVGQTLPCRTIGGDYFDYLRLGDGRETLIVADVAGKGMPAALMMMNLQARVTAMAEDCQSVADFVSRLNRSMNATCRPNRFITLFACAIDVVSGVMTFVNAGHNPPLLVRANGAVEKLMPGGPVVGLIPFLTYEDSAGKMEPGDLLMMYSDGITEPENKAGEEFGLDRLAEAVLEKQTAPLADLIDHVQTRVTEWCEGAPAADDQTLVVVRRAGIATST
ncbi:MAG: SpoIIE family protein phosphatase [Acidobacteria bacterium]|nr:SpoIIE family protein phosphatase [Acidobacteriota bacterium]